ncbi:glycoside hydrolase family 5 protein [Streptomonospora sp. PA3]|uniref:glycoside hydrolase family 5 protein n=1 Tax=Streptomonospora sp. PA3 TaxID=2607326 RepID=UPI0012DEF3C0|nr:cellulase family glycosylhydrolase [Streptomonospora sp. PA3]MUL40318.1 glycoside hydrolase family 5 protein [Streptomonospora sp. PA3]
MGALPWLRVDGPRIADEHGRTVTLHGVGIGGWLNMENFITGYPGAEQQQRAALRSALGEEGCARFFDGFLSGFFAEADAAHLASLGFNSVRIPVNYRHFEDDLRPFELRESGFTHLDRVIAELARHGLWSIVDLHALPGCQNQHWHSDNPTHVAAFWQHRHFQDRAVWLWEAIADRYRDRPEVAGYNPMNEPADPTGELIGPFYERLERAVRAVDPRHILFLDGNRYATDFSAFTEPLPNTVYSTHDYALPGIAGGTGYPGTTRGEYFDRSVLEQTFLRRTEYMRRTRTPVWIGEFGPVYPTDRPLEDWRLALLADQLDIYREHGASWSLWTYKDLGLQGLVHARPDSPYVSRIADVLAAKHRLGTDSWGGSDAGVRAILDPVDEVFDREFPGFEPYPWGRRQYIAGLIRHILLAEPLVERFGAAFAGVPPEEAERLAASFRFENCAERTGLSAVLRAHLRRSRA